MEICIIATICKETGALSIYNQMMTHLAREQKENVIYYVFVDPVMPKTTIEGVIYIEYATNGINRIKFDLYEFKKICKQQRIKPDVIFSLNNSGVRYKGARQIIYYHQALPLYPNTFSPLKSKERGLWAFCYYYPCYVKLSLRENTEVVVQTRIIKDLFSKKLKFPKERIHVAFPDMEQLDVGSVISYKYEPDTVNFLYPATGMKYKEHLTLAESLNALNNENIKKKIRIHLTLKKGEHSELEKIIEKFGLQEQFVFHGSIPHERLLSMYKASDGLLFPSTIETIGLPLLEAATFGLPVLANELEYVKDVLNGYDGLRTVPLRDYKAWGEEIGKLCKVRPRYNSYQRVGSSDWPKVLQLFIGNQ